MNAITIKISEATDGLILQGAQATGLSKKAVAEKAVQFYVPRLLRGEVSIVEQPKEPLEAAAEVRGGAE